MMTLDTGAGTNLDSTKCSTKATGSYDPCYAAFLSLHLTPSSTGYFEVGSILCQLPKTYNKVQTILGYLGLACGP
jgi:hypothetical protein